MNELKICSAVRGNPDADVLELDPFGEGKTAELDLADTGGGGLTVRLSLG